MSQPRILVATTNVGKIVELKSLLEQDVDWLCLSDLPPLPDIVEDGETFRENARKKATLYAQQSGLWTLSDDSGLVVDALHGAPGVYSARYSGISNTDRSVLDHANMDKVLVELKGVPEDERTARFVCSLCLASPTSVLVETTGTVKGRILDRKLGSQGFGYDPIFFIPTLGKTTAQLTSEEKNAISHRGKALHSLRPQLEKLLDSIT